MLRIRRVKHFHDNKLLGHLWVIVGKPRMITVDGHTKRFTPDGADIRTHTTYRIDWTSFTGRGDYANAYTQLRIPGDRIFRRFLR